MDSNNVWVIDNIGYYPLFGDVLPNGKLRVPTFGRTESGVIWDGEEIMGVSQVIYSEWWLSG